MKMTGIVLAGYGAIEFLRMVAADAPWASIFPSGSPWLGRSLFLQSAVTGALVTLLLALIVVVTRLGTRLPASGTVEHRAYQVVSLVTSIAIILASLPIRGMTAPAQSTSASSTPSGSVQQVNGDTARRLAILERSLRALEEGDRELPRDSWDPAYVVQQIGQDSQALFAWVRDHTFWIPYRGLLRGPIGVLMDRQGNSLDRAALLATLLQESGRTVRLAHGVLTREQALQLLPSLVSPRSIVFAGSSAVQGEPVSDAATVAAHYQLDAARTGQEMQAQQRAMSQVMSALDQRVNEQTKRLLAAVPRPDRIEEWHTRLESAVEAVRDHWWVQLQNDGAWVDLDIVSPRAELTRAVETVDLAALPHELRHKVTLRVVTERVSNGVLTEERVLDHVLQPSELIGRRVILQFWPAAWPEQMNPDPNAQFGLRAAALNQHEWAAGLLVGGDVIAQRVIRDTGDVKDPAAANPWGGIGAGIVGSLRPQDADASHLTATWIEYETHVPGAPSRTVRRVVFDLIGPAARSAGVHPDMTLSEAQRLNRSLALMMQTEILPVVCDLAPEYVAHMNVQSLLANADLLRAIAQGDLPPDVAQAKQHGRHQIPPVSPLYVLALSRMPLSGEPIPVFMDRPNLLTRHRSITSTGSAFAMEDAIDIVANEVGVDLLQSDAFAARLRQGVRDTNAETLLGTEAALGNTAEAFDASREWVTVGPSTGHGLADLQLSADARQSISRDLERGYLAVAPKTPVQGDGESFIGWWRIDRSTGDTLGLDQRGWGVEMAERSLAMEVLLEGVYGFAWEYALCQSIPLAANFLRYAGRRIYGDWHPSWTGATPLAVDPGDLVAANERTCVIRAVLMGFLPTLPLVLMRVRYAKAATSATLLLPRGPSPPLGSPPPGLRGPTPPPGSPPPGLRGPSPPPGSPPPGLRGPSPRPGSPPPGLEGPMPRPTMGELDAHLNAANANLKAAEQNWAPQRDLYFANYKYARNMGKQSPTPTQEWADSFENYMQARAHQSEAINTYIGNGGKVGLNGEPMGRWTPEFNAPRSPPGNRLDLGKTQDLGTTQPGAPPNFGCPPNCANSNPTVGTSNAALEAGSVGIISSFGSFR
jgi:hypothetical protein